MTIDRLLSLLAEHLSGVRTKDHVAQISRFHRIQASPGYDEAAEYVCRALEAAGIDSIVHEYPADGRSSTYAWICPPAWTLRDGELWQVEPERRSLGCFAEIPPLVCPHSPSGTFEGELVAVGEGSHDANYEGIDVSGRFVLATGRVLPVIRRAAPRGAVGVVICPVGDRTAVSHDLVQYQGIFPHADEIPSLIPAFSVSRRTADGLLRSLEGGAVRLRGTIDAEFVEGALRVVEASVPGSDSEAGEVLCVAHLCHPRQSANDNASGSAALIEMAAVLRRIAGEGGLRNTVRFLWVPEFFGSLPWAATHVGPLTAVHHVINLDMVGQSPERIGTPLRIFRSPSETPSYVDACVAPIARRIAATPSMISPQGSRRELHWILDAPSGGSDHLVFGASPHALPAIMLGHDDPYWHTDLDTVENVDPTRLKHVEILATALALLPSVSEADGQRIADWTVAYGMESLARARDIAYDADPDIARRLLDVALRIEEARLKTLEDLPGVKQAISPGALRALHAQYVAGLGEGVAGDGRPGPRRIIDGPLAYSVTEAWDAEENKFFESKLSRMLAESLLRLCDGRHTIEGIAAILSLDAGRVVEADDVVRAIELLRKAGYLAG